MSSETYLYVDDCILSNQQFSWRNNAREPKGESVIRKRWWKRQSVPLIFASSIFKSALTTYSPDLNPSLYRGLLMVFQVSAPNISKGTGRVNRLMTTIMSTHIAVIINAKKEVRGVLKIQSKIYDEAFLRKQLTAKSC